MKKTRNLEKTIAMFLIVLAVTMPVVFTALQPEIKNNELQQNSSIDFFANIFKSIGSFFDLISSVSAEDFGCCVETTRGAKCVPTIQSECKSNQWHVNQSCQDICQIGCCIDSQGGCSKNSASLSCLIPPATKFIANDINCEQSPICAEGCCTKGIFKFWSTNVTCSREFGLWDPSVPDETTCLFQATQEQYGCCKSYAGCEYLTGLECQSKSGDFSANQKCYEDSSCDCTLKTTGKCVDGYSDVYKEDTCGNVYVNSTPLDACSSKGQYCNPETNTCAPGDCSNIYKNNVNGDFGPKQSTDTAKNGDAWCIYDTGLDKGNGTAPMGSRHWRAYCLNGKESVEPCEDYRQQICTEMQCIPKQGSNAQVCSTQTTENSCKISGCVWLQNKQAYCTTNRWRECYNITNEKECNEEGTCFWWTDFAVQQKNLLNDNSLLTKLNSVTNTNWKIFVKDNYIEGESKRINNDLPICLPVYPPGLDDGLAQTENREAVCGLGSDICKYQEEWWGAGKKVNPECTSDEWRIFRAQQCKSLGDCGTWVNWVGKNTTGFKILEVTNATGEKVKSEVMIPQGYQQFVSAAITKKSFDWGSFGGVVGRGLLYIAQLGGLAAGLAFLIGAGETVGALTAGSGYIALPAILGAGGVMAVSAFVISLSVIGVGFILIFIAQFLDPGAGKGALESLGTGLMGFGIAALIAGSIGWATAGIGLGIAALFFGLYMWGLDTQFYYQQCNPSMPPTNGDDCNLCNGDSKRPCSKYRCESLGTACVFNDSIMVNVNGNPVEYPIAESSCNAVANDGLAPYITEIKVEDMQGNPYLATPSTTSGPTFISISNKDGSQIPEYTTLLVKIKLNEKSFCRYDIQDSVKIEDLDFPFDSTVLRQELKQQFVVNQQIPQFFVRCADVYQNEQILPYTFKFEAKQGPDLDPPFIIGTDRDNSNKFPAGTTQLELFIYVNKIADCRWSNEDMIYPSMPVLTQCTASPMQGGLKCITNLTGLKSEGPNNFFIRCNSTNGKMNEQSHKLTLYSTPPLYISSISPSSNDPPISGCELQSRVTLKVETAGGGNEGNATCYWTNQSNYNGLEKFDQTNSEYHEENITIPSSGTKDLFIQCVDYYNTVAQNSTTFSVNADHEAPIITRLYKDSGQLNLITNEPSQCAYKMSNVTSCEFNVSSLSISKFDPKGTDSIEHSILWMESNQWYVKCFDKCDNVAQCETIYPEEI